VNYTFSVIQFGMLFLKAIVTKRKRRKIFDKLSFDEGVCFLEDRKTRKFLGFHSLNEGLHFIEALLFHANLVLWQSREE
jgi:hypothetical protein